MNSILRHASVLVFSAVGLSSIVGAQVFDYSDGRKLKIEFVQEPPCPVTIKVESVNLKSPPDAQTITLQIKNGSTKAIRAYAMISGGNLYPTVHTWAFPTASFEPSMALRRSVWPNSQDHYYFFFDYILFADGTTCGRNSHNRSIQIANYLNARNLAIARVRQLALDYVNYDEILASVEKAASGGYTSVDKAGPPDPDTITQMPRRAYEHVVTQLRQLKIRQKEASELAARLEKEIPL